MSIFRTFLYFFKDITSVAVAAAVLYSFGTEKRTRQKAMCLLCTAVFACEAAAGFFVARRTGADVESALDFVSMLLVIASCFALFPGVRFKDAVLTVIVTSGMSDMLFSLVSVYLGESFSAELVFYSVIQIAETVLIAILRRRHNIKTFEFFTDGISPFFYVAVIVFEFTCYYREFGERSGFYRVVYALASLLLFGSIAYLAWRIHAVSARQKDILLKMAEQKEYAEGLVKNDDEMRRFRHDYKNHMAVVRALLDSGRIDEAERYLSDVTKTADSIVSERSTGNFVADTILSSKRKEAAQYGIVLDFDGSIPENGIANEDLCTVLSNLVDNAVEYCRTFDSGTRIDVTSVRRGSELLLSVENPVRDDVNTSSVKATAKADKRSHGFGIKNVERTAKKYDGAVTFECRDGVFRADVRMGLPFTQQSKTV